MRKSFTKFQRDTILSNQDLKCNICHARFGKGIVWHFDHISGDKTDNRTENGQAVCANCHDVKSRKENVERSRVKKDFDIVEYCPLCKEKMRGKNYLDDDGDKLTSHYMSANDWIPCTKCDSIFKIIRHDPSNIRKSTNKKHEGIVKYCMSCGGKWEERANSNDKIECECGSKFYVWIKKYNE